MDQIEELIAQCALFLSIGTSGQVYPAAGFVHMAKLTGAHCVELNLEKSALAAEYDEAHYGPASVIVPQYISKLLKSLA